MSNFVFRAYWWIQEEGLDPGFLDAEFLHQQYRLLLTLSTVWVVFFGKLLYFATNLNSRHILQRNIFGGIL